MLHRDGVEIDVTVLNVTVLNVTVLNGSDIKEYPKCNLVVKVTQN